MNADELMRMLKGPDEAVVFGTGFVAKMFADALAMHGMTDRVEAYTVTAPDGKERFAGRPVIALADLEASGFAGKLLLAVHEALADSLMPRLSQTFPGRVYWIYPCLTEMLYGRPIRREDRPVRQLLAVQDPAHFWITVRYAAVCGLRDGRETDACSRDLYIRALGIHCGKATAAARYERLKSVAASIAEDGYDPSFPILIDENGLIIDGLHRFSAACHEGLPAIPCEVVPVSAVTDRLLTARNRLPESVLRESGMTEDEIRYLKEKARELFEGEQTG